MTTVTMTLRERAEEAVKAATDYEADHPADDRSADEHKQWAELTTEAADLAVQLQQSMLAEGDLSKAAEIMNGMGLEAASPVEDPQDKLAAKTGIAKPRAGMTLGQVFAESPAYREFIESQQDASGAIPAAWTGRQRLLDVDASLFDQNSRLRFQNTLVTTSDAGTDAGFVEPTKLPGFINEDPLPESYLWDLCTKIPVTGEGFKFPRLISVANNAAFVTEATNTGVLTSDGTGGTVSDADGGKKPESGMQWGQGSGTVETVAHWIPITRQAAADAPQVVAIINAFLLDGLQVAVEENILNGDGNSPNLRGLLNTTNPYTNIGSVSTGAGNRFDAILAAIQAIRAANRLFRPNAVVINEADFFSTTFVAAKDGQGDWLFGGPASGAPGTFPLWGLRVVVSPEIPAGTQLVADWRYALIADRQRAQIYMTDSNRDWFERNLLAILAEQRMGFGVMAEQAFAQVVA